jgi:hypothetical protein
LVILNNNIYLRLILRRVYAIPENYIFFGAAKKIIHLKFFS